MVARWPLQQAWGSGVLTAGDPNIGKKGAICLPTADGHLLGITAVTTSEYALSLPYWFTAVQT
jgi:hypothetical protein